jgi:ATP-dependent Lhr-like helicase
VLRVQARWSRLPDRETLLVERLRSREGHHLFVYPFAGRLANEGLAVLCATRLARSEPRTFSLASNDYGFELLSPEPLAIDPARMRELLSPAQLAEDLVAGVNLSEISRRQFRDIARIAGLVFQGLPGASKPARQLQASSGLMFEVLEQYDAGNLLLDQARLEVLEAQLEMSRIAAALERIATRRVVVQELRRLTPLAFPLWASRLQSQMISTESWQERIERAARELEAAALDEGEAA